MLYIYLIWPIITAIANRIRGGWLSNFIKPYWPSWNDSQARLFVSLIISYPLINKMSFNHSILFVLLVYLGFCPGWNPWFAMKKPLRDIPIMTLRGLLITFPAGYQYKLTPFAMSGALMGIIYFLCWKFPPRYTDCSGYNWIGSDWGELFFGLILGIAMILSIDFYNVDFLQFLMYYIKWW